MSSLKYSEHPIFDYIVRNRVAFPTFLSCRHNFRSDLHFELSFFFPPDELYLIFFKNDIFMLQFYIKMRVTVAALWLAQVSTLDRKSQACT